MPFLAGVLYLAHFGDGIGGLNNCRVRASSRQDDMHHLLFRPGFTMIKLRRTSFIGFRNP
jgi:hypothetical protein